MSIVRQGERLSRQPVGGLQTLSGKNKQLKNENNGPVVFNRGAAVPLGALKISRGAADLKLDVFLLEKYIYGCRQIVLFPREGAANQKRSRTTAIEINIVNE